LPSHAAAFAPTAIADKTPKPDFVFTLAVLDISEPAVPESALASFSLSAPRASSVLVEPTSPHAANETETAPGIIAANKSGSNQFHILLTFVLEIHASFQRAPQANTRGS